jgi:hypothetical protein
VRCDQRLLHDRRCYICPCETDSSATYDAELRGLLCGPTCAARAEAERHVFDYSRRRRLRPMSAWKSRLRAMRPSPGDEAGR